MTPLLIDPLAALAESAGSFMFRSHLRAAAADVLFSPRNS